MIKPINISPLNVTNTLEYKCEKCGNFGIMKLETSIVNVDEQGEPIEELDYECTKCGDRLDLQTDTKAEPHSTTT